MAPGRGSEWGEPTRGRRRNEGRVTRILADDEEEDRAGDEVGEADGEAKRERDTREEGEHDDATEGEHGREDEHLFA